jgi:glycosyltransferase involved in cell wall biosynthesis
MQACDLTVMRVALVIYGSLETISGGYLYDRKLVEHLKSQGDLVEIISLPWRNYARHLGDNLAPTLLSRLNQLRVDILLQDELNHPSLFWINRRLGGAYPLVSIVHHLRSSELRPAWQNHLYHGIERSYLSSVDGFIFNSLTTRQVVEGLTRQKKPCLVAYPAGDRLSPDISDEEIAYRALQPGALRLFFLGNVIPRKGLHTLLEALNMLPREAWRLFVAGRLDIDRAYTGAILQQVARSGLSAQVAFLGPLADEGLSEQLRISHVLVLPSSYEGFGIAYLEGMGFGLPAIATSGGAAGEIITHGRDGFLIKPGDVQALRNCLWELATNRQRLLELSLAARKRYAAHPGWEQTGRNIRGFLENFQEA